MAAAVASYAAVLAPQEALQRARQQISHSMRKSAPEITTPKLKYTLSVKNQPAVYVFDQGETAGFMVVSADDATPAMLGYSNTGTFNPETLNPALRYWLRQYGAQIEFARANAAGAKTVHRARPVRAAIEPMTVTRWNQDAPYNNDCPVFDGERSVTGCVATAMAQVMKYHNWPEKGTSSHSYTCNGTTLSVDFANTTYDWANMENVYTASSTAAQNAAVATLMYSCGVSVDMQYSPTESGTASLYVPAALINYFGYDKGVRCIPRDPYGLYDWEDMVYENLQKYGPVQYSGQSSDGGHSFVCDGYQGDGYFHINWGWGGMSDGYFLLTALDPETQGIGGSTSGYNYGQNIIYGATRPVAGSKVYEQLYGQSNLELSTAQAQVGQGIYVAMTCVNYTPQALSTTVSLKFTPVGGGDAKVGTGSRLDGIPYGSAFSQWEAGIPNDLADGTYTVTPCFETSDGEWRDIPTGLAYTGHATAKVENGVVTFSESMPSLAISEIAPETPFYIGSQFNVSATVANTGAAEYYGGIALALIDSVGNMVGLGATYPVDIMEGRSSVINYVSEFHAVNGASLTAGKHYICFVDPATGMQLSDMMEIDLKDASQTAIKATQPVVTDAEAVDAQHVVATTTITCADGYYGGPLTLVFFPYQSGSVRSVGSISGGVVFVNAGDSQTVTFSGQFQGAEAGKQYMCGVFAGSNQVSELTTFTVKDTSGVTDIEADEIPAVYYDLRGVRIDNPQHGSMLIRKQGSSVTKIIY